MSFLSKKPEDIFLPRTPSVQWKLYIERPKYKAEFHKKLLTAGKNLYIFWMSWAGKSFLYKKELDTKYIVLSAGELRDKEIEMVILEKLGKTTSQLTSRMTKKWTTVWVSTFMTATWNLEVENTESIIGKNNLLKEVLSLSQDENKDYWIIDNIEQVSKDSIIVQKIIELAKKLSDDSNYVTKIKLILVSTTKWKREFWQTVQDEYTDIKPFKSVLWELEIWRMELNEAADYIQKGFNDCWITIQQDGINKIIEATDRIPHELAQLCLEVGYKANSNWVKEISPELINEGIESWIKENFSTDIDQIGTLKNSKNTTAKLRDKVLFIIAKIDEYSFKTALIVDQLNTVLSISSSASAISQALETLVINWLLERDETNTIWVLYRFCEPKQKLVLRYLLQRDESGEIKFIQLSDNQLWL